MDNRELTYVVKKAKKSQDVQSASWRPRRADGINSSSSPSAKAGKHRYPNSKAGIENEFPLKQPFFLLGFSADWMGTTHIRESNLLDSVY